MSDSKNEGVHYVLPPPPITAVPVFHRSDVFAVRRVYCVGRNYAAHVREMGLDPTREPPFFFSKPADAVIGVRSGQIAEIEYPSITYNLQHEIELVVAIGQTGCAIPVSQAYEYVWGYGVGLDMTRRDLQLAARDKGRPWEPGKAFDQSAPMGEIYPAAEIGHPKEGAIWLELDGIERQRSDLKNLIWSIPEIIANLSTFFELQPGDLVFSGTPDGVGPVSKGSLMRGGINGLGELTVRVMSRHDDK